MSVSDVLADMFVIITNGGKTNKDTVRIPFSKEKESIVKVLESEGYVSGYEIGGTETKKQLEVKLKYNKKKHAIEQIVRESKPGRRVYYQKAQIPRVRNGYGVIIMATSSGVMSGKKARTLGIGGEAICKVW
jgi:small subunit ribosomal protein S8